MPDETDIQAACAVCSAPLQPPVPTRLVKGSSAAYINCCPHHEGVFVISYHEATGRAMTEWVAAQGD